MNTKTETSDLKWTTFSLARPEVRNPSLRRVVCVTDTDRAATVGGFSFGFQLFLCYFGYKRAPYMAANWQNKSRAARPWDCRWMGSRCFDFLRQCWESKPPACPRTDRQTDTFMKWSSEGLATRMFSVSSWNSSWLADVSEGVQIPSACPFMALPPFMNLLSGQTVAPFCSIFPNKRCSIVFYYP